MRRYLVGGELDSVGCYVRGENCTRGNEDVCVERLPFRAFWGTPLLLVKILAFLATAVRGSAVQSSG